jgi:sec-independent protein translocase protein TatA
MLAFIGGGLGWAEMAVLAVLGVLIFGRRLPEVGRSLGRGIVEFKKGLAGIEDEVKQAGDDKPASTQRLEAQPTSTTTTTSDPAAETEPVDRAEPAA